MIALIQESEDELRKLDFSRPCKVRRGGVKPRAEAWRGMATLAGSFVIRGYAMFSVIERTTGEWLGRVGPWFPEAWPGTEVGWGLKRSAWGRGYAFEAADACIDFALTVAAEIAGPTVAQTIQLLLEYAPAPPFNSGSPETAPPEVMSNCRRWLSERA